MRKNCHTCTYCKGIEKAGYRGDGVPLSIVYCKNPDRKFSMIFMTVDETYFDCDYWKGEE